MIIFKNSLFYLSDKRHEEKSSFKSWFRKVIDAVREPFFF